MPQPTPQQLSDYLKCVVYDLYVLSSAVEEMTEAKSNSLAEVCKTAALIKLRAIYDFLYRPNASDSIKRSLFTAYSSLELPAQGKEWSEWLTHRSISTYIVHLDKERVTKTIPQPKFGKGERAVLAAAVAMMHDAKAFVESVSARNDFPRFDKLARNWWSEFVNRLNGLSRLAGVTPGI